MSNKKKHSKNHADSTKTSKDEEKVEKKKSEKTEASKEAPKKVKVNHTIRRRNSNLVSPVWMWSAVVLAILLVGSLATGGFQSVGLDDTIKTLDSEIKATSSEAVKVALTDARDKIQEAQVEISKVESTSSSKTPSAGTSESFDGDQVVLEMYVMSQCPYGTQVVDAIAPVKKELGDALDLRVDYIFYDQSQYSGRESQYCVDDLCGMHGVPEVEGNIVQLCAQKYSPDLWLDMAVCQNENMKAIPGNWEKCAKDNGLNVEAIKSCFEGEEGKELARESSARAKARQASGSPTIFLSDKPYQGGRTDKDFLRSVCNAFDGERPQACNEIPEPVKFDMIVLNDELCDSCSPAQIEGVSAQLFPGVKSRTVDVNSEEGKELVAKYGIELAPAYIFGSEITTTETWEARAQIQGAFEELSDGKYKLLDSQTGAEWFIDPVKRKEALEKPIQLLGVEEGKPQLDFFVMSFCPFGIQAENGIIPVQEMIGDAAKFVPRFVIYGSGNGCITDDDGSQFCSLHGREELDEDIRQMCIWQEEPDKFFPYIKLVADGYGDKTITQSNIVNKWEDLATSVGIDTAKINACFNDEARVKEMLRKESNLNKELGVRGSPSIFVDGQAYKGGRTAGAYQSAICAKFPEGEAPAACDIPLMDDSSAAAAPAGSC